MPAVGASASALMGEDPLAGATGAVIGELTGMGLRKLGVETATLGVPWAQASAALTAGALNLDPVTAASASGIAARENAFMVLPPPVLMSATALNAVLLGVASLTALATLYDQGFFDPLGHATFETLRTVWQAVQSAANPGRNDHGEVARGVAARASAPMAAPAALRGKASRIAVSRMQAAPDRDPGVESMPMHERRPVVLATPLPDPRRAQILATPPEQNFTWDEGFDLLPNHAQFLRLPGFEGYEGPDVRVLTLDIDGKLIQKHHVISDKNDLTAKHDLWKLAGMHPTKDQRTMLLPTPEGAKISTTDRSLHLGRQLKSVNEDIAGKMQNVVEIGTAQHWTQAQYRSALEGIIREERQLLKSGERMLNKHHRPWAKHPTKKGGE